MKKMQLKNGEKIMFKKLKSHKSDTKRIKLSVKEHALLKKNISAIRKNANQLKKNADDLLCKLDNFFDGNIELEKMKERYERQRMLIKNSFCDIEDAFYKIHWIIILR